MIYAIVHADKEWGIGKGNDMMFSLPKDMKFFRETTMGHTVVMGGNTLRSFPNQKPLKNRVNIVLSRGHVCDECIFVRDFEELKTELKKREKEEIYIIGGGVMYREITKGNGPKPSPKSFVTVYYIGKLINGKIFDQTQKGRPATFRLNELITGWITAMREMPCGSRWEVVIPYNLGYGSRACGNIKAFSTLIFDITLLDVR